MKCEFIAYDYEWNRIASIVLVNDEVCTLMEIREFMHDYYEGLPLLVKEKVKEIEFRIKEKFDETERICN